MSFVHLHVHTEYSLLDGSNKVKDYVNRVKELGMNAAAITDHGVMYGVYRFYKECVEAGIRPVIGCEVYVAPNSRFDKELTGGEERYNHLILLAENDTGYKNLMKIVSRGFTEGFYYKPRVDKEILREFHEGLICLSACVAGEVPRYILKGLLEEAKTLALGYQEIFGRGNYFLELQNHGLPEQQTVNSALIRMSKELDIPLVCTNDVHYTNADDVKPHDILLCIQTRKLLKDEDRLRYEGGQFYVKSEDEMRLLFSHVPEALENTQKIADRCNVTMEIEHAELKLPHFEVPEGYDSWTWINKLCLDGLKERYGDIDALAGETGVTYREKLESELAVIRDMGFVDYFLIVADYVNYARNSGIMVGPGRGSAVGSIVSYALKITNIDPIRYNLFFERFLNKERVSMPDIDIDFPPERRQDMIDYVERKYGKEKVVQIITFGTLAARGVIKDVGRVMDLNYAETSDIAKMIPADPKITLDKALKMNPELRTLYETKPDIRELIDMSKRLEGLPRHSSIHASGVVICPEAAEDLIPLSRGADNVITTQFDKDEVEKLGLLKMDFLGLRNLTVIQDALDLIKKDHGIDIDIDRLDLTDKAVYDSIGTGQTDGVFQLESGGMRSFMKELKPASLEDIIAGVALYRPGPMASIPAYIRGKNKGDIHYLIPELEPILSNTYGCIVYQEQVMQIVRDLAGYSMGRSDQVRKSMAKKKPDEMEKERQFFVYGNEEAGVPGCIKRGIDEQAALKIFDQLMDFAEYAFNKAHAACYAVIAYQTAWLKYHYPIEYMAALMTSVIDVPSKVAGYILVSKSMGIKILPPDVNTSVDVFSVEDGAIRYALTAIKFIGRPLIDAIIEERTVGGPFTNIQDFVTRMSPRDINKGAVEHFIKAGALDGLGGTRKQFMCVYSMLLDQASHDKKNSMAGQMTLFDLAGEEEKKSFELNLPDVGEYEKDLLLSFEKEVLGVYVSGHPLESVREILEKGITNTTDDFIFDEEKDCCAAKDNAPAIVGGVITEKKVKYTKNDKVMAFVTLEDLLGSMEIIVFPNCYEKYSNLLEEDAKVFVKGRVSNEADKNGKVIADKIISFDELPKKLWIRFPDVESYELKAEDLKKDLHTSDGNDAVVIYIEKDRTIKALPRADSVSATEDLTAMLSEKYGEESVRVTTDVSGLKTL